MEQLHLLEVDSKFKHPSTVIHHQCRQLRVVSQQPTKGRFFTESLEHFESFFKKVSIVMSWRGLSRAQMAECKASFESEGTAFAYEEIQRRKSKPIDPQLFVIPSGVSEQTWVYENLRSLVCDLNFFIASLDAVCDITSCPLMTATPEWEYKCAAHKTARDCCAVDYMCHTSDGTSSALSNNKTFPSRSGPHESKTKYFEVFVRRLFRIFSHAYFHHPEDFARFEDATQLYQRFTLFSLTFNLITTKLILIPSDKFPLLQLCLLAVDPLCALGD